jgi:orotidine-5'-phosphate decarboxylase
MLSTRHEPAHRLCVGVDPHPGILRDWQLPDSAAGCETFGRNVISDVIAAGVGIIKPQVAFFERHGVAGMAALSQLMGEARAAGLVVIADAKRGDVGSTVKAYADAWLAPGSDFESDAMTAVCYQGVGSIEPMCEAALTHGRGLFALVNTSNPDGWDIQAARTDTQTTVAQHILDGLVARQALSGTPGWMGAVIGATVPAEHRSVDITGDASLWVLAPGFGYQGAQLKDLPQLFGPWSHRVIPTVSRSIVAGGPKEVSQRLAAHLTEVGS